MKSSISLLTILLLLSIVASAQATFEIIKGNGKPHEAYIKFQGTFVYAPTFVDELATLSSNPRRGPKLWTKINIQKRKVTIWTAMSNSGSWGQPKMQCELVEYEGEVVVGRGWDSDGRQLYMMATDDCTDEINLIWRTGKFYFQRGGGNYAIVNLTKVSSDYNPWN